MAEKNIDARIAEIDAEKAKLEAEKEKLRTEALPQYPKWIADPTDPEGKAGSTVYTAAEEKARLAGYADAYAASKKKRDLEKKIADMRAEADKAEQDAKDKLAEAVAKDAAAAAKAAGKK